MYFWRYVAVAVTLLGENDTGRVICDVTSLVTDESHVIDLNSPGTLADSSIAILCEPILGGRR